HPVPHRLGIAECTGSNEDDPGIDGLERLIVQAQALERARRHIGDDYISANHQLADDLASLLAVQIESHRPLVAVQLQKHGALAVIGHGHDVTILPSFHALDSDDIGTVVSQQSGAVRTRDKAAEIQDFDTFEYLHKLLLVVHEPICTDHQVLRALWR